MGYWPLLILFLIPVFWLVMLHFSKYWKSEYEKNEERYAGLPDSDPKNLSSNITFVWKFIIPTLICPLPLFMLFVLSRDFRQVAWYGWVIMIIMFLNSCVFIGFFNLKKVAVDSNNLYISNFLKTWTVPLSNIDKITQINGLRMNYITIHFKSRLDIGNKIIFIPTFRIAVDNCGAHPSVSELLERRGKAINMNA